MALTKCKECGKEVSTSAKACPHCGVKDPGVTAAAMVGGFLLLVFVAAIIGQCSFGEKSKDATKTEYGAYNSYEPTPATSYKPSSSTGTSNEGKEQKALSMFMYVSGKCGGLSGAEEDACVDRTRNELNTEGKAYFDAYFGK